MKKEGQVWVETVIYTLIAFVMIAAVLGFVKPKIQELQDKAVIEQTLQLMEDINSQILSVVQGGAGNKRIIDMTIEKGMLQIDGQNNKIIFILEGKYTYSEPGQNVNVGSIVARTEKQGKLNIVTLTNDYSENYDLQYAGANELKTLTKSSTSYKLSISNNGKPDSGGSSPKTIINFELT